MIELIEGLPDGVVGLEAVGALESYDRIRLVHVLGDRLESHTAGAVGRDAMLGISQLRSFERIAVVTDLESIRVLVKTAGWSVPCEIRLFANAEREEAEVWAGEELPLVRAGR